MFILRAGNQFRVQPRRHNELSARCNHRVDLLRARYSTRTDKHFRTCLTHQSDCLVRPRCAKSDFRHGYTARTERFCQRRRVAFGMVELNDRHHTDLRNQLVD